MVWLASAKGCCTDLYVFGYTMILEDFNPFNPDSVMSKIDKCSKITNWVKFKKNKQTALQLNTKLLDYELEISIA